MKKRNAAFKSFIASLIASVIAQGVNMILVVTFWLPEVFPVRGCLVTGIGVGIVPFVLSLIIYLSLMHFLNKKQ